MTKTEIITKFHLFMDDTSDLSSQEESDLFDKILDRVYSDRPWEILKKAFTGTQSTTVDYVDLPSDFQFLTTNSNYTENNAESNLPVVFVGSQFSPYKVINYSDRRQYRNKDGYCYIDIVNSRLVFTLQPTSAQAVEYDYCHIPTHLTSGQTPLIPTRFQDIIYHGMCVDDFIIQQSEKARSYATENQSFYLKYLDDMALWNANLIQIQL